MRFLLSAFLIAISQWVIAQNPVKWSFESTEISSGEYELLFKAKIDKGWHVYTTKVPEDGPIPTSFTFKPGADYKLSGGIKEQNFKTEMDPQFDMKISYYENTAVFKQRIKTSGSKPFIITGELEFMVCNDEQCLPPDILDFKFNISPKTESTSKDTSKTTSITTESGLNEENPIGWIFTTERIEDKKVRFKAVANLAPGWHVYADDLGKEAEKAGPVPTSFTFETNSELVDNGKIKAPKPIVKYDPNFMMNLRYFETRVEFIKDFKISGNPSVLKGSVEFMVCNEEKCLPNETLPFQIDLSTGLAMAVSDENTVNNAEAITKLQNFKISTIDKDNPLNTCGTVETTREKSFFGIFILGFLGGLIALLTPCVFPMIPLTVSFFTKSSGSRRKGIMNANLYGFFIFAIYILLSLPFHFLDSLDPEILNTISTNIYLNLIFFVVFIVFAISFFGYFEITVPSKIANKADSASEIGGLIGIFFMALTLALVSFSCTGPILGSLLAGSLTSDGGAIQLTAGMGGFGLALALPFTLFALFPGMLKSLPKSGGWLTSVKVVLGFIELALAIKFLSNADLVDHWGLVKIEPFLISWIIIAIGLALYLFGKLKFPHDSPIQKLSLGRIALGISTIFFIAYLASGFIYDEKTGSFRSLSLLSGLAPPTGYSWIYPNECPQNLNCFHSYEEGLAYARKVNKPILLDFTGWACVNCRKMEQNVWDKPEIFQTINEDYVLISLYVDDREKLPEAEQFEYTTSEGRKKKVRNIGNKWATFQVENFAVSSQPYYALITPDERLLNHPVDYTPDVSEYKQFLECGLETFRNSEK